MQWLPPRFWYQKQSVYSKLLLPLSCVYRVIIKTRRWLYQHEILKSCHFNIPIIVVGNITVGGTGKTPLVIGLVTWLKSQGYCPGIVSRGYGGKARDLPKLVNVTSDPYCVGDEAVLIAQKTLCPIVVDSNRSRAVRYLMRNFPCDIVVSDDGLQHYRMIRDIEIAIVDGMKKMGNEYCLPAGPLREPKSRLKKVDFIITHHNMKINDYYFYLKTKMVYQLSNPLKQQPLSHFQNQRVHAVTAIGNPDRFFGQLRDAGIHIIPHVFSDHYYYKSTDLNFKDDFNILMTEKDAVKCRSFLNKKMWCVPVEAYISQKFTSDLLRKLQRINRNKQVNTA